MYIYKKLKNNLLNLESIIDLNNFYFYLTTLMKGFRVLKGFILIFTAHHHIREN